LKAAILYEVGKPLVVENNVSVDEPGKGEVKVKMKAVAVCHSDLHFFKGEIPAPLPGIAGHECAGVVDKVGEGVDSLKVGDPVVVGTVSSGCGHCYYCTIGLRHYCTNRFTPPAGRHFTKTGQRLTPMAGPVEGFAEYTTISSQYVTKIPADMPMDKACLLACGVSTGFGAVVNRAKVQAFNSVVVIGTGGVGLNTLQGARFCGGNPIIAVDVLESKLDFAKKFGATNVINAKKEADPIKKVFELTSGRGADFVFVTVGSLDAIRQGVSMAGPRGTIVMIGLAMGNLASIMPIEIIMGEKTITGCGGGSIRPSIDIPWLASLYQNGRLMLDELITAYYPFDKINDAIASLEKGQALRNIITFD
jgi:S-(hydroxymethyl)glutathione dehydrogenase / alcohol dehydrogenase